MVAWQGERRFLKRSTRTSWAIEGMGRYRDPGARRPILPGARPAEPPLQHLECQAPGHEIIQESPCRGVAPPDSGWRPPVGLRFDGPAFGQTRSLGSYPRRSRSIPWSRVSHGPWFHVRASPGVQEGAPLSLSLEEVADRTRLRAKRRPVRAGGVNPQRRGTASRVPISRPPNALAISRACAAERSEAVHASAALPCWAAPSLPGPRRRTRL